MPTEPQYDPATCITAGELRELGATVPDSIPDCGWVPRAAMHYTVDQPNHQPQDVEQGILRLDFTVTFTEPFRWLEINTTVTP